MTRHVTGRMSATLQCPSSDDHSVMPFTLVSHRMADTKKGRNKKARDAENRQRKRDLAEARERDDEAEPPRECQRRDCSETATFVVVERYQEETGHGVVEATADLCTAHTADERPTNLEDASEDYLFRVEPLPEPGGSDVA